ncbi:MAG TPA: mandelate racemase/muconate lactonizing enzyme family protein [Solirubrobacteraceae bacterium]|nr:mandelate racemase/muconate lactonizing enzyme family protein [Solirubrobacteraceae bacterium]
MELAFDRRELRFAQPLTAAFGVLHSRELVEVTLTGADGIAGHGEAAALEPYDGVSTERVLRALEAYRAPLAASAAGGTLLDACRARDALPQALAAIDIALWDLAGKRAGRPVCDLLSDAPASAIAVNASVAAPTPQRAARAAADAVARGYSCVKLKVGFADDLARVAAVREAIGPNVSLRLDANGAWSVAQAERLLSELGVYGLELVEEPVRGLPQTRKLRARVPVRIAIDETAALPGALTARVADAVCLKVSRCGGIGALLAAATLVRTSGAEVYLASTYDGPRGIAAALHAAAALAPLPSCGLATLELFEQTPLLPVVDGELTVPRGPGLGL